MPFEEWYPVRVPGMRGALYGCSLRRLASMAAKVANTRDAYRACPGYFYALYTATTPRRVVPGQEGRLARIIHRAFRASGQSAPEGFTRMIGTEVEADAGAVATLLFTDPAGNLQHAQTQGVELIPRAGHRDESATERVEQHV